MATCLGVWAAVVIACTFQHVVTGQQVVIQAVRLQNGNVTAGRVEVQLQNGTWGTVCDDNWSNENAKVVCRTLQLTGGIPLKQAFYGGGTGPILMDDVYCAGDESRLGDCSFVSGTAVNCGHDEDASVVCQPQGAVPVVPTTTTPRPAVIQPSACTNNVNPNPRVRLNGIYDGTGYVMVRADNGTYGYLCDDGWDENAAKVVCKELCYNTTLAQTGMPEAYKGSLNVSSVIFAMDQVLCNGLEGSLADCSHDTWFKHNCIASEVATVTCVSLKYATPPAPQPILQCDGSLIALFNKSRDTNLEVKHLSIYNQTCADLKVDTSDPNFISVRIPFDKCNTIVRQNATHIIYTNTIFMQSTSRQGDITRSNEYVIPLTCEMPRNETVNNVVQPMTETVTQKTVGNFVISLKIYQDQLFKAEATTIPFRLTLGNWLNIAVELNSSDPRLLLVVKNCRARASGNSGADAIAPKNLLIDKCIADRDKDTVEVYPLNMVKFGIRLQSFLFVNYPNVVLECDSIVCLSSEVTAECDRSCNNTKPVATTSGRRRRETNELMTLYTVTSWPVYIDLGTLPTNSNSTSTSTTTTSTPSTTTSATTTTSAKPQPTTTTSSASATATTHTEGNGKVTVIAVTPSTQEAAAVQMTTVEGTPPPQTSTTTAPLRPDTPGSGKPATSAPGLSMTSFSEQQLELPLKKKEDGISNKAPAAVSVSRATFAVSMVMTLLGCTVVL